MDEETPTNSQPGLRIAWDHPGEGCDSTYTTWETTSSDNDGHNVCGGGMLSLEDLEQQNRDLKEQMVELKMNYEAKLEKYRHQIAAQDSVDNQQLAAQDFVDDQQERWRGELDSKEREVEDLKEELRIAKEKIQEYEQEVIYRGFHSVSSISSTISDPSAQPNSTTSPESLEVRAGMCTKCEELQQQLLANKEELEGLEGVIRELKTETERAKVTSPSEKKTSSRTFEAQRKKKLIDITQKFTEKEAELKKSEARLKENEAKSKEAEAKLGMTTAECQEYQKVSTV